MHMIQHLVNIDCLAPDHRIFGEQPHAIDESANTVNFVTDIKMLCQKLNEPSDFDIPEDYFYLDETFKLWRKLLCSR